MNRLALPLAACLALTLWPAAAVGARGFSLGVAAGEITPTSAILWARADRSGRTTLEVARDRRFRRREAIRTPAARRGNDNTVQAKVTGLRPGTRYFYRFRAGRSVSDAGRFETAPAPGSSETVEFGYTGDYDAQPAPGARRPFWNSFGIFSRMQREGNDFNIAIGDTIYSDSEVPGVRDRDALTVAQKWAKYRQNLALAPLSRLRGSAGFYSQWDDHEFYNDFSPREREFETGSGADERKISIDGRKLFQAGSKAFRDYAPVTYTSRDGLYRSFRWGRNLELFFLDERSFRDAKASEGGVCNNPRTGSPDFAPTAPQERRNFFSLLVPELSEPVPQACIDRINDPNRDYLGDAQFRRFTNEIRRSKGTFKVIVNELPIQQYYVSPYDRWEGYEAERRRLIELLRDNVRNVVFITADVHATLVGDVRLRTLEPGGPVNSGILEVTVGSAATANLELEIENETGRMGSGRAGDDAFLEPQPPDGVGLRCSSVNAFSYAQVRVARRALTITPKGIDGRPLKQEDGMPCGPFTVSAR